MPDSKANIIHIFHSSFIVETKNHTLVFDYAPNSVETQLLSKNYFSNKENVYVFVTHGHGDHYSSEIFEWGNANPDIKYIISSDVEIDSIERHISVMSKYEEIAIDDVKIKTYGTTDRGLSYLVYVDGLSIYHAGDLNWWHWEDDSPEAQKKEELDFKYEVSKLEKEKVDIAFVPVDPRLGKSYFLGGEYFAKVIKPKLLVPMHFGNHFEICKEFGNKIIEEKVKVAILSKSIDEFSF